MNHSSETESSMLLSQRILEAVKGLFPGHPVAVRIQQACAEYEKQCRDIHFGRGIPHLTIAVIGAKGQGKTWVVRQCILDRELRTQLPSGVLSREATRQLVWIGALPPKALDRDHERFIPCPPESMLDLGIPYMLLDTPGSTDANPQASEIAKSSLSLSPIQFLVIRRDQLRAATTSPLAERSEGVICLPIITAIPLPEMKPSASASVQPNQALAATDSLRHDLERWMQLVQSSAPNSQLLDPILLGDFEASGDEHQAGEQLCRQLVDRLRGQPLDRIAQTTVNRLDAAGERLKHQVHRLLQADAPQLARAVGRLHDEAKLLPRRAIESILGAPVVLEAALRARMRAQIVTDTSPLWFPYRTTLSLLSFTQGAWDRLILAMTGSIPSLFGTLVAWARNLQQSRQFEWETQQGLRERLNGQVQDQLGPIQLQFHRVLSYLRGEESRRGESHASPSVRLTGIDELQARSRLLFEQALAHHRPSRWTLSLLAIIAMAIFWSSLAGPIVSIYRDYFAASYQALATNYDFVGEFHHPSLPLIASSVVLSYLPMLLYSMIGFTWLMRRAKVERISDSLQNQHHALVDELQQQGILRLEYEDPLLEQAQFLVSLDRKGTG